MRLVASSRSVGGITHTSCFHVRACWPLSVPKAACFVSLAGLSVIPEVGVSTSKDFCPLKAQKGRDVFWLEHRPHPSDLP